MDVLMSTEVEDLKLCSCTKPGKGLERRKGLKKRFGNHSLKGFSTLKDKNEHLQRM